MLFNVRWGNLHTKIVAWFFIPSAVLLIGVALVAYLALQGSASRGVMAVLLLASLGVSMAILGLGVRRIAKPLAELTQAAQEVAQGNFGLTVSAETGDEIEELAGQFNRMSVQLRDAYANLEKMVAERTHQLESLNAIAQVVSSSLNPDNILEAALEETLSRLGMQAGAILLLDGEKLKLRTQLGFPESAEPIFQAIGLREGICGEAIKLGQPVWLDIEAYRDKASARLITLMEEQGVQTLFSAPILHKERALGAIALVAGEKCAFTPQETALLMSIGGQIGVAIENARLYEQARQEIERRKQVEVELRRANQESDRRNRELTLLNRVITATTSDMEPQAILESVCRELVQAFGVAQSAAALLNEAKTELTVVSECRSEAHPSAMGVVIPVAENPASLYVLKQKKPLSLPDAQNDILLAPVREVMRQRGTVSLLLLPIVVHGEALGTIGVDATERREFSDEEIALAERVTAAVGQVLERAGN